MLVSGGGAPPVPKNRRWRPRIFSKDSRTISFYPQHFLMTFLFSHRKLQQNKYTATMASATRRQIIGDGAPINKLLALVKMHVTVE